MPKVEAGKAYWGFNCTKCHRPFPFVEEDPGNPIVEAEGFGFFELKCPYPDCGHTDKYDPTAIHRMTAHQKH